MKPRYLKRTKPTQSKASFRLFLIRLFPHLPNFVRLFYRLNRDPRVLFRLKAMMPLTILYILSPLDLIPDTIPFIGQLDDLTLFLLAFYYFIQLSPQHVVQEHVEFIDINFSNKLKDWLRG